MIKYSKKEKAFRILNGVEKLFFDSQVGGFGKKTGLFESTPNQGNPTRIQDKNS